MIEIYGASDDCIEVSGCEGADEFYADGKGCWRADLVGPGGTERCRVLAEYDPDGSGCWVISLSQTEEGVPFPGWGNGTGQGPNDYSVLVRIDAPDGTRLESIEPAPQAS